MLLAVEEKLEGLKYNQDSAPDTTLIGGGGDGVGVHRERDMTTLCKKGSFNGHISTLLSLIVDFSKTEAHIFSSTDLHVIILK